jgi:hypothetical protein
VGHFADLIDAWAAENDANEKLFRLGAALLAASPPTSSTLARISLLAAATRGRPPGVGAVCQMRHGT